MAAETSSSTSAVKAYDVFLNFRGEDTRTGFISHLYACLRENGVETFMDEDGLDKGQVISPNLLRNIEESRIAVVVFSENYATSRWCLDELVKNVECKETRGQTVWPVFYRVNPTVVRHQKERYGEALAKHAKGEVEPERVAAWGRALTAIAAISGWRLVDEKEADVVRAIVGKTLQIVKFNQLYNSKNLVGMESHLQAMVSLLDLQVGDVRMVGIWGMGGIGKTTIAKAVYDKIAGHFEYCCFVENVRETCEKYSPFGLLQVQKILLSQLNFNYKLRIGTVDGGINIIRRKLREKRVLIVLDDIDHQKQLEALAGECDWFGPGSRVIITTRNERLLAVHRGGTIYSVRELTNEHALQLLRLTAFRGASPSKDYKKLTYEVVKFAKGLPLVIKVLGSHLLGRRISEWKSELVKMRMAPDQEVFDVLKVSFDGLDDSQKSIFLDFACFFKGENLDRVKDILESCGVSPEFDITVLVEKTLVFIENGRLEMHDMIQEMGREIVRRESTEEPGERSRLWSSKDVLQVLEEGSGTNKIRGIKLVLAEPKEVCTNAQAFTNMRRLRFFIGQNAFCLSNPLHFPNGLRWLEWHGYASSHLPLGCKELVKLCMSRSKIKLAGDELKSLRNLKSIDFSHCELLTEVPDVSSITNLEILDLRGCTSLEAVHESLGTLKKLVHLNFLNCRNLCRFPSYLRSKSLKTLVFEGCSKLKKFPDIQAQVEGLKQLLLQGTAIVELPSSIGNFVALEQLNLINNRALIGLPSSIHSLHHLELILLHGCSQLNEFPRCPGRSSTRPSLSGLCHVVHLDLAQCCLLEVNFLEDLRCFSVLKILDLSGNRFITLPACLCRFTHLQQLNLTDCKKLQEIQGLPPNLTRFSAEGCESLESCVKLSSILWCHSNESPWTRQINFYNCHKLMHNQSAGENDALLSKDSFGDSRVSILFPGSDIPDWFSIRIQDFIQGFSADPEPLSDIAGLVFCFVLGPGEERGPSVFCEFKLLANDQLAYGYSETLRYPESDHIWLVYVPLRMIWGLQGKSDDVLGKFMVIFHSSISWAMKKSGVHLALKQGRQHAVTRLEHPRPGLDEASLHSKDCEICQGRWWRSEGTKGQRPPPLTSQNLAYVKNFANQDGKVWLGAGGRNWPPEAPPRGDHSGHRDSMAQVSDEGPATDSAKPFLIHIPDKCRLIYQVTLAVEPNCHSSSFGFESMEGFGVPEGGVMLPGEDTEAFNM